MLGEGHAGIFKLSFVNYLNLEGGNAMSHPQSFWLLVLNIFLSAFLWTVLLLIIFMFTKWFAGWPLLAILAVWLLPIVGIAWRVIHRSHRAA